jgi:hypothetical protein
MWQPFVDRFPRKKPWIFPFQVGLPLRVCPFLYRRVTGRDESCSRDSEPLPGDIQLADAIGRPIAAHRERC